MPDLPLGEQALQDLQRRMTEPSRHYPTLDHLDLLWGRHLQFRDPGVDASHPGLDALIALSIAYHDSVYVAGRADNEARSADLWLEVSATATNLALDERLWVADTIRATGDHLGSAVALDSAKAEDYARQWVLDLDLTPLGEAPEIFDRNMELLEAESEPLPEQQRKDNVHAGLRHFASARPLYRSKPIAAAFADAAQRNFERHLRTT